MVNNVYDTAIVDLGLACHQEIACYSMAFVNVVNLRALVGPSRSAGRWVQLSRNMSYILGTL